MFTKPLLGWQNYTKILYATIENWNLILECTYTEDNILSKSLCKICKIKPPYLNFQWLIGPSSIYVAKQQRTKWNHQKKKFLTFQWLCLILYLYKQFLRLGQHLPLSYLSYAVWQFYICLWRIVIVWRTQLQMIMYKYYCNKIINTCI